MKRLLSMIIITSAIIFGASFPVSVTAATAISAPAPAEAVTAPAVPAATPEASANAQPAEATPAAPVESSAPAATPTTEAAAPAAEANNDGRKQVARVVWVKGTFMAAGPGSSSSRELKKDAKIYMNDTLTTDANSQAQIVFTDNSTMAFRGDTKFYINEYNYSPKSKAGSESTGKYVMDLIAGGFRTITGLVAKNNPNDYAVNTPVATIGVRGTEYSAYYKDGKLYTKRYKGKPCMSKVDKNGKKQTVCMDDRNKYGMADENSEPTTSNTDVDGVFANDVELIVTNFDGNVGGGDGSGGTGFCIQ